MRLQIVIVLPLILACHGIKVPIDRSEEVDEEAPVQNPTITPTYYVDNNDGGRIDSYLIPPNPHQQETIFLDKATPASYLLPPSPGKPLDFYYNPTEPGVQSDWYPIAQDVPAPKLQAIYQNTNQSTFIPIQEQTRRSKSHGSSIVPVPSTGLEPPLVGASNEYFAPPSVEEIPLEEIQLPISVPRIIPLDKIQRPIIVPTQSRYELPIVVPNNEYNLNYRQKPNIEPTLALHLIPPQPVNYKIPTKLYPKKFGGEFKPVPIPIAQYLDASALEIPRAKPVKLFKPLPSTEIDYLTPTDEKINYLYRKAEHKRKLKGEELSQDLLPEVSAEDTYSKYGDSGSTEQEASESNYRPPERNAYPAPLRQPSPAVQHDSAAPVPEERTEFRMHGMKGPHSYQFGFDTGKGKNRQFRFEERDNDGKVQGHYGYMDRHGKLRVVNYSADPKTGFHAEAPVDKE